MSEPNKSMTLAEATYHYLGLHKRRARQVDYEAAERLFQNALQRVRKPEEIRAALVLDKYRRLPVQMKSPAYERLLVLSGRTVPLLREYAQEMYEYGPEWTHYADSLWDEANALEEQQEGAD
jgi:hypothetical protein